MIGTAFVAKMIGLNNSSRATVFCDALTVTFHIGLDV